MAVRCVFFTPGETEPCQVLRMVGASPVIRQTQEQLEGRYCLCGRFIACPIFKRVERGLDEANEARTQARARIQTPADALAC